MNSSFSGDHLTLRVGAAAVPLGFAGSREELYLVAADRAARWPVALLRDGVAEVEQDERAWTATVSLVTEPSEKDRVLELFRKKYGDKAFERWYARPARVLRLLPAAGPVGPADGDAYRAWLESEFDNVADDYDRHILGNRMNRLLRDRSLELLRKTFSRAHSLLEVGCGSGMETLPLLREGHEILCVDISGRMLEVVRRKAVSEGVAERLRTVRARAADLSELTSTIGGQSFEGAYSTYGALNCEADLGRVAQGLHTLLRTQAHFVAGVYNRWCLDELVGYTLVGDWSRAFGRAARPVRVGSSRFCVDVFAHSPRSFAAAFAPGFRARTWQAVPAFLPPSDLTRYAEVFSRRFSTLDRWDRRLARTWPWRSLGDHFLMTLDRVETSEGRDPPAGASRSFSRASDPEGPPGVGGSAGA